MIRFPMRRNGSFDFNKPGVVYGIYDPVTEELFYIGYTSNFKTRVAYHLSNKYERNKKAFWIKQLLSNNLKPVFKIISEFDTCIEAIKFEKEIIIELKPICNTK